MYTYIFIIFFFGAGPRGIYGFPTKTIHKRKSKLMSRFL